MSEVQDQAVIPEPRLEGAVREWQKDAERGRQECVDPGMAGHGYNLSTLEVKAENCEFETSLSYVSKT